MIIKSQEQSEDVSNIYRGAFEIDKKGEVREIRESLIVNEEMGQVRAIAEFLEDGYEKQEVTFTTYFSPLKLNDIISIYSPENRIPKKLSKDRFIVKKIIHTFKDGVAQTKITGVRYD